MLRKYLTRASRSKHRYVSGFFVVPLFAWCACFSRQQLGTNDPADGFLFACAAINTCFAIFDSRKPKSFRYATAEQRKLLGLPELSDEDIEFDRAEMPKSIVRDGDTSVVQTPISVTSTTKSSNIFSGSTSVRPSTTTTTTTSATPLSRSTLWFLRSLYIVHSIIPTPHRYKTSRDTDSIGKSMAIDLLGS